MREEKVTINILNWLEEENWRIICYDFPQSGTGIILHPNSSVSSNSKNEGSVIPDIIAVKGKKAVFFENKDRYVENDFKKIRKIKSEDLYSDSLNKLLSPFLIEVIYFGIGIPNIDIEIEKSIADIEGIDFLISVDIDGSINVNSDILNVFSS